jgi:hypothetical protein
MAGLSPSKMGVNALTSRPSITRLVENEIMAGQTPGHFRFGWYSKPH